MDKKELFNFIAPRYDRINQMISLCTHKGFKHDALSYIPDRHENIVDLCCGTGDIIGFLKNFYPKSKIVGVDFSSNMLNIAKNRFSDVEFLQSDITSLPFEDKSFDLCTISFGLRNVDDRGAVLRECSRVLKPNGIFFNLDLGKPNRFWSMFLNPYMNFAVPVLGKLACGKSAPLKYFVHSNKNFPHPDKLCEMYKKHGLIQIARRDYLFGQISSQICKKVEKHL